MAEIEQRRLEIQKLSNRNSHDETLQRAIHDFETVKEQLVVMNKKNKADFKAADYHQMIAVAVKVQGHMDNMQFPPSNRQLGTGVFALKNFKMRQARARN